MKFSQIKMCRYTWKHDGVLSLNRILLHVHAGICKELISRKNQLSRKELVVSQRIKKVVLKLTKDLDDLKCLNFKFMN